MAMDVTEFSDLIEESFRIKEEIQAIEKTTIDRLKERLAQIDGIILQQLEELDVNSYKTKAGTVSRRRTYSVRVPKAREDKEKFFAWLKEKDQSEEVFYHYVNINSQSLNSLYNEEMNVAKEAGDFDFAIPGIGEPSIQESIQRRKK